MDRVSSLDLHQSNLDWIHAYPSSMGSVPGAQPANSTGSAQGWPPSLGLNTYDFAFDDSLPPNRKFSATSNPITQSSMSGYSPLPSIFPSVSSVQSSPHTSPTSADPALRGKLADASFPYIATSNYDARQSLPTSNKRPRDDLEQGPPRNVKLDEENRYLVYLRDQQRLPWKEISRKFERTFQRPYQAPALQMRYGRLKNRLHPWTDADTNALQMAQEYYMNKRFEIIAQKMMKFGATDNWAPRVCARKLRQLDKDGNLAPASPTYSSSSAEEVLKHHGSQVASISLRSASPQLPDPSKWISSV